MDGKPATLADCFKYFAAGSEHTPHGKLTMSGFRAEWQELSDQDKADLKQGIGDGSLTY